MRYTSSAQLITRPNTFKLSRPIWGTRRVVVTRHSGKWEQEQSRAGQDAIREVLYCDYCNNEFQETPSARKRYLSGLQHQRSRAQWYASFKDPYRHGGPLLRPAGSIAKGVCHHFVHTVMASKYLGIMSDDLNM